MRKQFYSVKEVNEILGRSADRLYEDLRQGRINGTRTKEHNKWMIPAEELERLGAKLEDVNKGHQLMWGAILNSEGALDSCPVGPKAYIIDYDPSTWPWSGHAYTAENGVEKEIPVVFYPYRSIWRSRQE